jgi:hypothetical protein
MQATHCDHLSKCSRIAYRPAVRLFDPTGDKESNAAVCLGSSRPLPFLCFLVQTESQVHLTTDKSVNCLQLKTHDV